MVLPATAYHALSGIATVSGLSAILDVAPSRFRGVALGVALALPAQASRLTGIILAFGREAGPGLPLALAMTAGIALALVALLPGLWRSRARVAGLS